MRGLRALVSLTAVSEQSARDLTRRFGRNEEGGVVVLLAIGFALVMFAAAMAIDYGRAENERAQMQRALDAAALAAAHRLGLPDQDERGRATAEAFFRVNMGEGSNAAIDELKMSREAGEVRAGSGGSISATLLSGLGIRTLGFGASSRVVRGDGTVEVALVLDNSGSMAGQSIIDLRSAATDLVSVLLAGTQREDQVRIAVVPFAGSVNIGSHHRHDGWIDTAAVAPLHGENFDQPVSRFELFDRLSTPWRGCVEARPAPHDVTDTVPTSTNPATLFVPMMAPDEPDSTNAGGGSYPNNYISDFGGTCPAPEKICVKFNTRRQVCEQWGNKPIPAAEAQARTCKYANATPNTASGRGPNYGCTTAPLLPLTSHRSTIEAAIAAMGASGSTNIGEGLMWGWRALSPEPPFTEGRPWSDQKNQKIIVLMTDGENTYNRYSGNHNWTWYGAFGFAAKGRLGTTNTASALLAAMNSKTLAACSNAKARGVIIYTIAFRLETDPNTLSLLRNCASGTGKAHTASDGAELIRTFQLIGREISQLRVAG